MIFNYHLKYKQGYPLIDSQVTPMIFLVNTLSYVDKLIFSLHRNHRTFASYKTHTTDVAHGHMGYLSPTFSQECKICFYAYHREKKYIF